MQRRPNSPEVGAHGCSLCHRPTVRHGGHADRNRGLILTGVLPPSHLFITGRHWSLESSLERRYQPPRTRMLHNGYQYSGVINVIIHPEADLGRPAALYDIALVQLAHEWMGYGEGIYPDYLGRGAAPEPEHPRAPARSRHGGEDGRLRADILPFDTSRRVLLGWR